MRTQKNSERSSKANENPITDQNEEDFEEKEGRFSQDILELEMENQSLREYIEQMERERSKILDVNDMLVEKIKALD